MRKPRKCWPKSAESGFLARALGFYDRKTRETFRIASQPRRRARRPQTAPPARRPSNPSGQAADAGPMRPARRRGCAAGITPTIGTGKRACNSAMLAIAGFSEAPKEIIPRPTIEVAAVTRALPRIAAVARRRGRQGQRFSGEEIDRSSSPRAVSAARSAAWACCKSCFNCRPPAGLPGLPWQRARRRWPGRCRAARGRRAAPARSWAESRPSRDARR